MRRFVILFCSPSFKKGPKFLLQQHYYRWKSDARTASKSFDSRCSSEDEGKNGNSVCVNPLW